MFVANGLSNRYAAGVLDLGVGERMIFCASFCGMNHAETRAAVAPKGSPQVFKRRTSPADCLSCSISPRFNPASIMSGISKKNRSLDYRDNPMKVIYAHDLNGNLTFLNRRGEQLLGYSCEEVRHMNIAEIVTPEVARRVRHEILNSTNRRVGMVYEIEVIAKDGHRVPLEISTSVVFHQGEPIEIEGIAVPPIR